MGVPRVHVTRTGNLTGNERSIRGEGLAALVKRPIDIEWPCHSFVIEHAEGLIAIDTGLPSQTLPRPPLPLRHVLPDTFFEKGMGPAMREAGLDPSDVRVVILTHLDRDHAGGLEQFPAAEVLVHRPEWEFGSTFQGRQRYVPDKIWPTDFAPTVYDLDREPYGSFPASKAVTEAGDIRLVPLAGHTPGQVGVVLETGDRRILFSGDHVLRQDHFLEDYAAGQLLGIGGFPFGPPFGNKPAIETSQRLHSFLAEAPTVLVPSHDEEAPARLEAMEPVAL